MGRPSIKFNPEIAAQVQAMSQYGAPQDDIATALGMSLPTLRKLYRKELQTGAITANTLVGKKLYERCQAGDVTALIFWAKTRMGWRETDKKEAKADDGTERLIKAIAEAYASVGK